MWVKTDTHVIKIKHSIPGVNIFVKKDEVPYLFSRIKFIMSGI